ncbi:hypothetical protein [Chitinophaga sp. HK235]|uniref:hypothetical protein n=1 Tax=Chitinophaga sp. HK235 TaxID=2952571 RepID=UPI001BA735BC|nr:hypothetical protein [Chitinophaga sp. HK235]
MKNKFLYIVTLAAWMIFIFACTKNDNAKLPDGITKRALPQLSKDATKDQSILAANLPGFNGAINVALYFPDGEQPKTTDVVVAMNGKFNNIKVLQGGLTSLPASVPITGPQLMQLFSLPANGVKAGDFFDVAINFNMNDGRQLHGFGDTITLSDGSKQFLRPYGSDVEGFAKLVRKVTFTVK